MNEWPEVMVDGNGDIMCPIPNCEEALLLRYERVEPLIAEQEPDLIQAAGAWWTGWEVSCTEGHVVWTIADQARADGGDPTDPDGIEYDHMHLHGVVNALLGGQP